jgi:hypothetical protein
MPLSSNPYESKDRARVVPVREKCYKMFIDKEISD